MWERLNNSCWRLKSALSGKEVVCAGSMTYFRLSSLHSQCIGQYHAATQNWGMRGWACGGCVGALDEIQLRLPVRQNRAASHGTTACVLPCSGVCIPEDSGLDGKAAQDHEWLTQLCHLVKLKLHSNKLSQVCSSPTYTDTPSFNLCQFKRMYQDHKTV